MKRRGFFITGTDTNIGKTWATVALMRKFRQLGHTVAGMKPVASGCEWRDGRLMNQDALLIQENAFPALAYEQINPYAFEPAVSPHLACAGAEVSVEAILVAYDSLQAQAETVLVEGAGGWLSPLSLTLDNAGLAGALQIPVLLVVGMRLGCINQARLSYQAIRHSGVACAGWIAAGIDPDMQQAAACVDFLQDHLDMPLLAVLPHSPAADFDLLAAKFKCLEFLI
ncbi:MAG: dethiobiotin synthase [Methylococcales bacterium]|nr:dethiobiotin synthase [Methylococcales bacterium]